MTHNPEVLKVKANNQLRTKLCTYNIYMIIAHAYNHSTWEAEAGELHIQDFKPVWNTQ
jgi:hypothetical protein